MSDTVDTPKDPAQTTEATVARFNSGPVPTQARRDGVALWALHRPVEERIRRLEMAIHSVSLLQNATDT